MVGSYGPKMEEHIYTSRAEEIPKGLISRGEYSVESKFTDDDGTDYLEWKWKLKICKKGKNWGKQTLLCSHTYLFNFLWLMLKMFQRTAKCVIQCLYVTVQ